MNRNKVYLLAGIVMIALSAGGWLLYGLKGSLTLSHAQSATCTGKPSGYFFEDWSANELTSLRQDENGNRKRLSIATRGGVTNGWQFVDNSGSGLPYVSEQDGSNSVSALGASIAPTKWQVTGQVCP